MFWILSSFWVFLCNVIFYSLGTITTYISRKFHAGQVSEENESSSGFVHPKQDNKDRIHESNSGNGENRVVFETATSKYQFSSAQGFSKFVEEPKAVSFTVQEMFVDSIDPTICTDDITGDEGSADKVVCEHDSEVAAVDEVESFHTFNIVQNVLEEEKEEELLFVDDRIEDKEDKYSVEKLNFNENDIGNKNDVVYDESLHLDQTETGESDDEVFIGGDESESFRDKKLNDHGIVDDKKASFSVESLSFDENECGDEEKSVLEYHFSQIDKLESPKLIDNLFISSDHGEFFSEDVLSRFMPKNDLAIDREENEDIPVLGINHMQNEVNRIQDAEEVSFSDRPSESDSDDRPSESDSDDRPSESDSDDEFLQFKVHSESDTLFKENSRQGDADHEPQDEMFADTRGANQLDEPGELPVQHRTSISDFDDEDDLDMMWEHDDIVEQLKMELRNVRTGGLPTILEESESDSPSPLPSPTIMNDLKPLKIETKFEHKDLLQEIQKVYKSYADKMRKLDILNYQTLHAIGFLQLKGPIRSTGSRKSPMPMVKSLVSQNLWLNKLCRNKIDPMVESMAAYYRDLEIVYVGHVCLSWEILQWQHGKAHELLKYDSQHSHRYNQLACEFQLFHVLIQRFLENEPFQGPRVENYVKNRCVVRNLLQVPLVKDDSSKDKKDKIGEEDVVSVAALIGILRESMRLFWDFIHADKDEPAAILKASKQGGLQDAADLELLFATRSHLQKKERKLKDIIRSSNCIVKKLQKNRSRSDYALLFVQIELKLVSRVLNMPRITKDQLLWCNEKLDRINIVSRKIHREPYFLLFPC